MNIKMLKTDYYQLTMSYAFIMLDMADTITGYEGFIRHIKPEINPDKNYMIFDGEKEVKEFIKDIREEISNGSLEKAFIDLLEDKITTQNWKEEFKNKFQKLNKEFEFNVVKNGTYVMPYVPVFQYKGPKWIGQIIETYVTNIYNGKTGLKTIKEMKRLGKIEISSIDIEYMESIVNSIQNTYFERYTQDLHSMAKDFKESAKDKIILEAAFRRAPSFDAAYIASKIAIDEGWSGTSNTSLFGEIPNNKIGGTMAHAFVMSFESEIEAFRAWNKIFPKSTMLIDTYDTIAAVKKLVMNSEDISKYNIKIVPSIDIKPNEVRIDSGDFYTLAREVRTILDNAGWNDVKIFISGDLTPELITDLINKNVPFDKFMAGTKYIYNNSIIKKCNSGFVYKIVEYEKNNVKYYPEKKAENKSNYPGLKVIEKVGENEFVVNIYTDKKMDISETKNFNENSVIIFDYKNKEKTN